MPYQNLTNITGLTDAFQFINAQEAIFGVSLLLIIAAVSFFVMKERFEASKAFAATAFITFISAALFRAIGIVSTYSLVMSVVALILGIFWVRTSS